MTIKTVIPAPRYRHSLPIYRHSRVSGNPEKPDRQQSGLWHYRSGFPLTRE